MSMLGRASDQQAHDAQVLHQFRNGIIEVYGLSEFSSNKEILQVVLDSKLELDQLRAEKTPQPEDLSGGIAPQSADENFGYLYIPPYRC